MKKSLFLWQILGFVFTGAVGVILHFLFGWFNESVIVAPFSAVNESIWEHTKLIFFPMFIFAVIENLYVGKDYKNFWCVKLIGIVIGICLIPVLYYTIDGIFGGSLDFVNIAIFFVASAISYLEESSLVKRDSIKCKSPKIAVGALILLAIVFAVLTFLPPQIPLFEDPVTGGYGI